MTKEKLLLLATCAALAIIPGAANAQDFSQDSFEGTPSNDLISFSVGYYDIMDDDGAMDFRVEYRPDFPLLLNELRPWVGAEVTSDLSIWAGGGILYDWNVAPNWYITPSFGVGVYDEGSSDKDLDYPIEFRSQLEAAYQFDSGQRAGVAFGHLSNASLGDDNPGTEVLSLYWHVPY